MVIYRLLHSIFFLFLSGSQQHPGEPGDTHEWSGGCKGWEEGVRKSFFFSFQRVPVALKNQDYISSEKILLFFMNCATDKFT